MIERTIRVYIGGPCHGTPLPDDLQIMAPIMHVQQPAPVHAPILRHEITGYPRPTAPEGAEYLRRSYRVGTVAALAWVVRGITDQEAAELVWTYVLDAAGVPAAPERCAV